MTEALPIHYKRHRFPAEIIAHAVWLIMSHMRLEVKFDVAFGAPWTS